MPTATAGLFWQQVSRDQETAGEAFPATARKPYRRLATIMCVCALPLNIALAGGLFIVFPRLAFRRAFVGWGAARSGYTDQVNLAQTGQLGQDSSPVLWLRINPASDRNRWDGYLRGSTLDYFDGRRWSRSTAGVGQTLSSDAGGFFRLGPDNIADGLRPAPDDHADEHRGFPVFCRAECACRHGALGSGAIQF